MNGIIKNILKRRSIRKYRPEQIRQEDLDIILETGLYAPCAGGRQGVVMVACQNREINLILGKINHSFFHGRMSTAATYISEEQPSSAGLLRRCGKHDVGRTFPWDWLLYDYAGRRYV